MWLTAAVVTPSRLTPRLARRIDGGREPLGLGLGSQVTGLEPKLQVLSWAQPSMLLKLVLELQLEQEQVPVLTHEAVAPPLVVVAVAAGAVLGYRSLDKVHPSAARKRRHRQPRHRGSCSTAWCRGSGPLPSKAERPHVNGVATV